MALFEVTLFQTYAGQECINRWNYVGTGVPASVSMSFALTSALGAIFDEVAVPPGYPPTGLMKLIAALQSGGVTFDSIVTKDIYSVTDFYSALFTPALTGGAAGEGMSPIDSMGFFTNRVRSDIRRATKRFVGCSEANVGALGVLTGAFQAALDAVSTAMGATLTYVDSGNTLTFTPAVVSKEQYNPNPTEPDRPQRAYRYYATEVLQMQHVAQGVVWDNYPQVRSQVSRQYGKGR